MLVILINLDRFLASIAWLKVVLVLALHDKVLIVRTSLNNLSTAHAVDEHRTFHDKVEIKLLTLTEQRVLLTTKLAT